ncbi:MAG: glycosyltransferase family 39 protein [Candidatus Shapirobacteria bacterium]|jgi:hypothetical protein
MKKIGFYFLILGISVIYLLLRINRLNENIEFRLDQGIHLLETYQMVTSKKISLIGPMVTSKSRDGRNFYIGGNYYYALAILGIVSEWDPVKITAFYNFIELTFIIFFIFWLRSRFNPNSAIIIFVFLTSFCYLITHSRFFWNPHFLIPLGILVTYFIDQFYQRQQNIFLLLAAITLGNAVSFHYSALVWTIPIVAFIIFTKSKSIWQIPLFLLGTTVGALPIIIFELRHNFYNIRTIFFIFTHFEENRGLTPHYFVYPTLIFILWFFAYFQNKFKVKKYFIIASTFFLFLIGLLIPPVSPLDNLSGWDYPSQKRVVDIITKNICPENYNIASTVGGDTRSYDIRYLLTIRHCPPKEVETYSDNQTLFLVAPPDRPPETEKVWEVSSFKPFKVTNQQEINNQIILYRLDKT